MVAKKTTVAEWQSHFQASPKQTLPEYQADWTTIRNNAEGVGVNVAIATVRRYLEKFRASQNEPITASLGEAVPAFETITERVARIEAVDSDPVASLLILQSQLGSLTIEAEKHLGQCKYISDVLETTLSMLQENLVWSALEEKAAKLESELSIAQNQVENLKVEADAQKELRLRAVNQTVYGS
jgi:hypothetical protein